MTTSASIQAVLDFWAAHLGSRVQLAQPGAAVVRNGPDLADYRAATVLFRPPACVVAVRHDWYEPAAGRRGRRPAAVFDVRLLPEVFGSAIAQVIGPVWLGYADASDFTLAPDGDPAADRSGPAGAAVAGRGMRPLRVGARRHPPGKLTGVRLPRRRHARRRRRAGALGDQAPARQDCDAPRLSRSRLRQGGGEA